MSLADEHASRRGGAISRRRWMQLAGAWGAGLGLGAGLAKPITLAHAADAPGTGAIDIGSRRELFVDGSVIGAMKGDARQRLHHPLPREVAMVYDRAWEGTGSGYHTVIQDGDVYRMYYRGWHLEVSKGTLSTARHKPFYCYAESRDGIHWERPDLGILEFEGSKKNNIFWDGVGSHNFTPFLDDNPECRPGERFKALAGTKKEGGLFAFKSGDGIHWERMRETPVITDGAFDSQNLAFWDPTIARYRAYWRYFTAGVTTEKEWKPKGLRAIRTATSDDFFRWEDKANLTYEDSPADQLYTNQVKPYFRAPHILIGFPARYVERGWSDSMRALPEREKRELRAAVSDRYGTALTEGVLMASRNGHHFKRWNEAFLRPGVQRPGTWQYGQHYIANHVVETASPLPGAPNELSLYATEDYWHGTGSALRRYAIRMDGFVSVTAPLSGGELITGPLTFAGTRLEINFATSAAGSLRVEIQEPDGKAISGFALPDCPEHFGDQLDRIVSWKHGTDVGKLAGKPLRLRFLLKDADLYAFRFVEG